MVQRRAARFVKVDYSTTSSATAILADLQWSTLQQRRMQRKTVVLYRVVHQLVSISDTPFLIPARVSKGHNMKFAIPQSSVNSFPNLCHTSLEPAPSVSSLSTKLGGLQGPASIQLHVHVDQHQNFNLYINCF